MELDEMKRSWKDKGPHYQARHASVQELLQHPEEGPLARLKKRFRKSLFLIPAIALILIFEFQHRQGFIGSLLKYYLLVFCFFIELYFLYNYRLIGQMQVMSGNVKETLQKQVTFLRKGLYWRLLITRLMVVLFFVLLEVLFLFHVDAAYQSWQQRSLLFRLLSYAAIFVFFYFLTKIATYRRYKRHINELEALVNEMKE